VPSLPKRNDNYSQLPDPESLTGLPTVSAYRFPTFQEIVDPGTFEVLLPAEENVVHRPQGLFNGLLQDRIDVLQNDMEEHEDKYQPEVVRLVHDFMEGRRKVESLSEGERSLLDRATLDFATYVPPKKTQSSERQVQHRHSREIEPRDADPIPGVDVPSNEAPPYWWLK